MTEPRTVRELREGLRAAEKQVEGLHMSPATSLASHVPWYLRRARLALRQAERYAARADDPREEPLEPLKATLGDRRPSTRERRRRYRCDACMTEALWEPSVVERHPRHQKWDGQGRVDCGEWQPVARLRRGSE